MGQEMNGWHRERTGGP